MPRPTEMVDLQDMPAAVARDVTQARLNRGFVKVADYTRDRAYTVADRLEERARDAADQPFFVFEGRTVTFGQMNRLANRVGDAALKAGLKRGDVVALMMENRPEYVMIWLGLAKVGIIAALLNTNVGDTVLAHALSQTRARGIVYGAECAARIATLPLQDRPDHLFELADPGRPAQETTSLGARDFDALMAEASDADRPPSARAGLKMSDTLYYVYTSGTTGLPKAALMSHMRFLIAGDVTGGLLRLTPQDVYYNVLPLYHGAGGMVVISAALSYSTPVVLRRKFSASRFWHEVREHGVTTTQYIGEICRYLLAQPPRADDRAHGVRRVAGAGLKPDIWTAFADRFGIEEIYEGLGATEANYGLTNVDQKPGSVGRLPYPHLSNIRVVRYNVEAGEHPRDAEGRLIPVGVGETGELIARVMDGPSVAGFYEGYTSAEATEAKLVRDAFEPGDRWFRSGDLVHYDADDYFYFVDRVGDTFRWKSENVSTEEVAMTLGGFPGPVIVNVYGVEVPGTEGRAGMAALTYDDPADFDAEAFHRFAAARLPAYAVPVFVRIGQQADLTGTFKLRKVDLQREGYDPARTSDALYVRDAAADTYVAVTPEALRRLAIPAFGQTRTE